jgi:hypothetical protein
MNTSTVTTVLALSFALLVGFFFLEARAIVLLVILYQIIALIVIACLVLVHVHCSLRNIAFGVALNFLPVMGLVTAEIVHTKTLKKMK